MRSLTEAPNRIVFTGRLPVFLVVLVVMTGLSAAAVGGTIVRATCPCGYDSGDLFIFGGKSNFQTYCSFPVYCRGCPELKEADLYAGDPTCPDCPDQKALPYDHPSLTGQKGDKVVAGWNTFERLGRSLELTDGQYLCPACGKFSLGFRSTGMWD